jgi:hypothetical protein
MHLNSSLTQRELSRAVESCDSLDRLLQLQLDFPDTPLADFSSWNDARRWLRQVGAHQEAADAVLRPVLAAFHQQSDEIWHDILFFLFDRPLRRIHRDLLRLDQEPALVWSEIGWAFLRALHRLDLDHRTSRPGLKLLNDTRHDVRQVYARERARQKWLRSPAKEEDERTVRVEDRGGDDPAFEKIEHEHDVRWARAHLKDLVRRGRLSGPDYLILIGCHLYGHSLEEMADRLGLSYEATKRRRQRAASYLKNHSRFLSPESGLTPLRQVEPTSPTRRRHGGKL